MVTRPLDYIYVYEGKNGRGFSCTGIMTTAQLRRWRSNGQRDTYASVQNIQLNECDPPWRVYRYRWVTLPGRWPVKVVVLWRIRLAILPVRERGYARYNNMLGEI